MNRSILIVIVDFLLVSLVAFSRFDDEALTRKHTGAATAPAPESQKDMVDVLKISLDTERQSREQLNEKLRRTQVQLETRERVLSEREQLMREAEELLQQKADESARLEQERALLERQFAATQAELAKLEKQLQTVRSESKQQLAAAQSDLQAREQEEEVLRRKLGELEKTRQAAEAEKQRLASELQVAETERRLYRQQLDSAKGEVQVVRQEKAVLQEHATKLTEHATKLAEGVSSLAEKSGELAADVSSLAKKSGELTQEIRENRPLAPNTVFSEFVGNRVRADFRAVRTGLFGREVNREEESKTVLVRHGNQIFALYHVKDTPLSFSYPGVDWDWLIGNLRRGAAVARVDRISFLAVDPRVVVVPVSEAKARELGAKVYSIPKEPFKFQEAIVVGADEGYYGECKFQLEPENPQYVRMQRERFSWIRGRFAPSSGDLVFTKSGDLLGIMVNKDYCLLLNEFAPAYHIRAGIGIGNQQTGLILSQLYGQLSRMPVKLQ